MSNMELDADLYRLPKPDHSTCAFCDGPVLRADLCAIHWREYEGWRLSAIKQGSGFASLHHFITAKIRILRAEVNASMTTIVAEVQHMRGRAKEFLAEPTTANAYQLAHSVKKHCNVIVKEEEAPV